MLKRKCFLNNINNPIGQTPQFNPWKIWSLFSGDLSGGKQNMGQCWWSNNRVYYNNPPGEVPVLNRFGSFQEGRTE